MAPGPWQKLEQQSEYARHWSDVFGSQPPPAPPAPAVLVMGLGGAAFRARHRGELELGFSS